MLEAAAAVSVFFDQEPAIEDSAPATAAQRATAKLLAAKEKVRNIFGCH